MNVTQPPSSHIFSVPKQTGFTFIELLAVLAIISIMIGLISGIITYARRASLEAKSLAAIQQLSYAVQEYQLANGSYPPMPLSISNLTNWLPSQFSLSDPWSNDYLYITNSPRSCTIRSLGPDGVPSADDIEANK